MVSVIVLTYNRASLLKECIDSIINQSVRELEVVIIDDASTDNTSQVINDFNDKRIKYFKLEHTGNIPKLRNLGLKYAKGSYIAFCDDDDCWNQDKLEKQMKILENYSFTCSNANLINHESGIISQKYFQNLPHDMILIPEIMLKVNYIITSSILFDKAILKSVGLFNEEYIECEDYDFFVRVSFQYKIFFSNQSLINYRIHTNKSFSIEFRPKMIENSIKIVSNFRNHQNKDIREASLLGVLHFRKIGFQWYKKNRAYFSCFKEFMKVFALIFHPVIFKKVIYKLPH